MRSAAASVSFHFLMAVFAEQVHLLAAVGPPGDVNAEQPYGGAGLPVAAEELADFLVDFGVELRGARHRMGARNGGEVRVAQFELDGARLQRVLAQAASHHFGEPRQGGFDLRPGRRCPR